MRAHGHRRRYWPVLTLCASMLGAACDSGQLPGDASLSVSPSARSVRVQVMRNDEGACLIDPYNFLDIPVQVSLTNAMGDPLSADDVMAFMDFSRQIYGGTAVVEMRLDGTEPATVDGNQAVLFDIDAGSRVVILRVNLSCPFRGEFTVIQDTRIAGMSIEVTETP